MKNPPPKLKLPGRFDPQARWLIWYFLITMLVLWGWQELKPWMARSFIK